ncbi:MAG: pentapeptide repeat-containing protein [Chloroflexota bacterium]
MTDYTLDDRLAENRSAWTDYWTSLTLEGVGKMMLAVALFVAVAGALYWHGGMPDLRTLTGDFYANISSELASIVITVFVLDRLNQRRAKEDRKLELFRKAKSRSNDAAIEAVDQIRHEGIWDDFLMHHKLNEEKTDFYAVKWSDVDLSRAHLENAYLSRAYLENADLSRAHLENANLSRAHLENANLIRAHLENANLSRAHLENVGLTEAHLENAKLTEAQLENANLSGAQLENAELFGAQLENAELFGAQLENAKLFGARLKNANLWIAPLRGAKDITDAQFNEQTVLPDAEHIGYDDDRKPIYDKYWTPETDMTRYTDPNHPDFWEPEWAKKQREEEQSE